MVEKRTEVEREITQTKGKIEYIIGGNIAIGANASTAAASRLAPAHDRNRTVRLEKSKLPEYAPP